MHSVITKWIMNSLESQHTGLQNVQKCCCHINKTLQTFCQHFSCHQKLWGYPPCSNSACPRPTWSSSVSSAKSSTTSENIKTYFHVLIIFPYHFFSCQNKIKVDFFMFLKFQFYLSRLSVVVAFLVLDW